jgi:hypothetical protein
MEQDTRRIMGPYAKMVYRISSKQSIPIVILQDRACVFEVRTERPSKVAPNHKRDV